MKWSCQRKGQTSLVLILLSAVLLIFFAITLNWGKVGLVKMQTTIASNTAASNMGSYGASYGEQTLQTTLGGRAKYCKSTSIWVAIGVLLLAIIITIATWGTGTPFALALVLAATSLALQVLVIQPGLTKMWNKLQANLTQEERFIENGLSTAMQAVANDPAQIPDYFDYDMDGRFKGNSNDTYSRYGLFYTERLRSVAPPDYSGLYTFTEGLKELVYDDPFKRLDCADPAKANDPCCPESAHKGSAQCPAKIYRDHFGLFDPADRTKGFAGSSVDNPCCVPLYSSSETVPNPNYGRRDVVECMARQIDCSSPTIRKRLRPTYCGDDTKDHVIDMCAQQSPFGARYPLIYDPAGEGKDSSFNSFREQLGVDDEKPDFQKVSTDPNGVQTLQGADFIKEDATGWYASDEKKPGIFPLFYEMKQLKEQTAPLTSPVVGSNDNRVLDQVKPMVGSTVEENQCALSLGMDEVNWKKGADQFCSPIDGVTGRAMWPYNANCPAHQGSAGAGCSASSGSSCGGQCNDTNATLWHDDHVDQIAYGLKNLSEWTQGLVSEDEIIKNFVTWYPQAATLIAPKCGECNAAKGDEPWMCQGMVCNGACSDGSQCRENSTCADGSTCSIPQQGMMRTWAQLLGGNDGQHGWIKAFDEYLKTDFSGLNSWCVPPATWIGRENNKANWKNMTTQEADYIKAHSGWDIRWGIEPWGSLGQVAACLEYNQDNPSKFKACDAAVVLNANGQCPSFPAACENLPRSLSGEMPEYTPGACAVGSEFKQWLANSIAAAEAQKLLLNAREKFIKDMFERAKAARNLFAEGYQKFDKFLYGTDSPAYALMLTRLKVEQHQTTLPNYIIYGWQGSREDKKGRLASDGVRRGGLWHIVRAEVYGTSRCAGLPNCRNRMPWVRTYTKGFLGTTRCYELTDHTSRVYVRVTRYDEDRGSLVKFANQIKLWQFRYSNPKREYPSDLEKTNNDLINTCGGVGILEQTRETLGINSGFTGLDRNIGINNFSMENLRDIQGAFMINNIGDAAINKNREHLCYDKVRALLDLGVSTETCAEYYLNGNHMAIRFVKCGWSAPN